MLQKLRLCTHVLEDFGRKNVLTLYSIVERKIDYLPQVIQAHIQGMLRQYSLFSINQILNILIYRMSHFYYSVARKIMKGIEMLVDFIY